jgi:hypothetical protein
MGEEKQAQGAVERAFNRWRAVRCESGGHQLDTYNVVRHAEPPYEHFLEGGFQEHEAQRAVLQLNRMLDDMEKPLRAELEQSRAKYEKAAAQFVKENDSLRNEVTTLRREAQEQFHRAIKAEQALSDARVEGRQEVVRSVSYVDAHTNNALVDALGSVLDELAFPLPLRQRAAEVLMRVAESLR